MTFAILPVKDPRYAKQRLAGAFSAETREALARLLYEEMIAKLMAARGVDRVAVVASDAAVARRARRSGALVFEETAQTSHSRSADEASIRARTLGARRVLLVPIDVPLATVEEIEQLAAVPAPVAIVPSADGTGTNALVRTPPDAIPSRFGPGSFRLHQNEAAQRGLAIEVLRPPGLLFDVDTPEDVEELIQRAPESPAARLLRRSWTSASQA
jgi:2-phospho-L-lactate guanylyltransferase